MPHSNIVQFLTACGKIKRTVRTGWTCYGIERPESVSDHMYRMALMATAMPMDERHDISVERLIKMTVVHDLAECIVGDITPYCNISREEKLAREAKAMDELCAMLPKDNADEILGLWNEYNTQLTKESILCKDFDKFEMLLQACEYEKESKSPGSLEDFFKNTLDIFTTPLVKNWIDDLCGDRKAFMEASEQAERKSSGDT